MGARKRVLGDVYRKRLLSAYESAPFARCSECEADLLISGRPFIVSKDYNYGEVVMEYAVCVECNEKHQQAWSEGSRDKVSKLYQDAAGAQLEWDPVIGDPAIGHPEEEAAAGSFDHCWLTGAEIPLDQPFQIVTMVQPTEKEPQPSSILLSHDGIERIQAVLSKQTRDERDRFRERVYPRVPPDWEDLPDFSDPELLHVGPGSSKGFH